MQNGPEPKGHLKNSHASNRIGLVECLKNSCLWSFLFGTVYQGFKMCPHQGEEGAS